MVKVLSPLESSDENTKLTIVLVSYNKPQLTLDCLQALMASVSALSVVVVLVDNASTESPVLRINETFPDVRVIVNDRNKGFGRANNQALGYAAGPFVLLLNTDAFVAEDSVGKAIAYMEAHPRCGILGVRLVGRDGSLQPSCRYFPTPCNLFLSRTGLNKVFKKVRTVDDMAWDHANVRQCDWVPGCFYLVRREVIDQVGLFDPRYFLYYEEVDHCFAARKAGWDVTYFPDTTVVHLGGESAATIGELTPAGRQLEALDMESELLYFRKNHGLAAAVGSLLLGTAAEALNLAKRLARWRRPFGFRSTHLRVSKLWNIGLRTQLGARPIH
jgi:GT2 family glycosyltransferase